MNNNKAASSVTKIIDQERTWGDMAEDWLLQNMLTLLISAILVVVGIIGYGVYQHYDEKGKNNAADLLFSYQKSHLEPLKKDNKDWEKAYNEFKIVYGQIKKYPIIVTPILELTRILGDVKQQDKMFEIVQESFEEFKKDPYLSLFLGSQLSALYEDQKKWGDAQKVLENIVKSNSKLLDAKIYYDLGRLSQAMGDKTKAQTHFKYVLDTYPKDQLATLAQYHLLNLNP